MFLHAGFLHLFGNMLFLWIYGDNVEHRLGHVPYLFWYLATGVAATLFHMLGASGSQIPLVGASGAISGMLGFYFVWFPRNQVRLLWLLPPFVMQVFEVPARLVLGRVPRAREPAPVPDRQRATPAWRTGRTSAASWPASRRPG